MRRRVKLFIGKVCRLDTTIQEVELEDPTVLPYDYLVLATGSQVAPADIPGFKQWRTA